MMSCPGLYRSQLGRMAMTVHHVQHLRELSQLRISHSSSNPCVRWNIWLTVSPLQFLLPWLFPSPILWSQTKQILIFPSSAPITLHPPTAAQYTTTITTADSIQHHTAVDVNISTQDNHSDSVDTCGHLSSSSSNSSLSLRCHCPQQNEAQPIPARRWVIV